MPHKHQSRCLLFLFLKVFEFEIASHKQLRLRKHSFEGWRHFCCLTTVDISVVHCKVNVYHLANFHLTIDGNGLLDHLVD